MTDYQESSTTHSEAGQGQRVATFKITQLIWLFLGILEGLLGLRFIFKLIGVNAAAPFAKLIYGFTDLFVMPFQNLIGTPAAGNMVMEISTIIAMIVYLLHRLGFGKNCLRALLQTPWTSERKSESCF